MLRAMRKIKAKQMPCRQATCIGSYASDISSRPLLNQPARQALYASISRIWESPPRPPEVASSSDAFGISTPAAATTICIRISIIHVEVRLNSRYLNVARVTLITSP